MNKVHKSLCKRKEKLFFPSWILLQVGSSCLSTQTGFYWLPLCFLFSSLNKQKLFCFLSFVLFFGRYWIFCFDNKCIKV